MQRLAQGTYGWARWLACTMAIAIAMLLTAPYGAEAAKNVWAVYNEAQALEKKGKYADAIRKYEQTIPEFVKKKEYSNAGQMYRRIGDLYVKLKNYDAAAMNYDQESAYYALAGKKQETTAVKIKADALRSSAKLFVRVDASKAGDRNYTGALFEPKNGALLGAYAEQDPKVHDPADGKPFYPEAFPVMTGKKHAGYLLYFSYGNPLSTIQSHIDKAKANGVALQLALQPLEGLDVVQDDAYLRGLARDAAAAGIPIFLRFANEMNGNWVPWFTTPETYIAKFRIVANVFKEEAPDNVAIVWSPDRASEHTIQDYYPGDAYVDWVGISLYSIYNPANDPLKQGEDRSSHIEKFKAIYEMYADRKPVFISEGAVSYMYPEKLQDKTAWAVYKTREFYATLPMLFPKVKGVYWFDSNSDATSRVKYYMLSANPKLLEAYKQVIADPFYLGSLGEEAPYVYEDASSAKLPAGKVKLSAYVKTWAPMLSKVTYEIGGKTVGTSTALPWTVDIDMTQYHGKTIQVTIRAYDNAAKLVTMQKVPITIARR